MNTYTNPKNGEKITTTLSFQAARAALKDVAQDVRYSERTREMARSLTMCAKPSQAQEFWIYKLAEDHVNPIKKETIAGGDGFKKVAELFKTALANGLNKRAIRLQAASGAKVKLTPAPDAGNNAGHIYIKSNSEYMGKVSPLGIFSPVRHCTDEIKTLVAEFGNNTVQMARQYGRMTSNCCFCARSLDTAESNSVGYGPVCAEKYGLPWGEVSVQTVMNKSVNLGKEKRDDNLTPRPDYREQFEGELAREIGVDPSEL